MDDVFMGFSGFKLPKITPKGNEKVTQNKKKPEFISGYVSEQKNLV